MEHPPLSSIKSRVAWCLGKLNQTVQVVIKKGFTGHDFVIFKSRIFVRASVHCFDHHRFDHTRTARDIKYFRVEVLESAKVLLVRKGCAVVVFGASNSDVSVTGVGDPTARVDDTLGHDTWHKKVPGPNTEVMVRKSDTVAHVHEDGSLNFSSNFANIHRALVILGIVETSLWAQG